MKLTFGMCVLSGMKQKETEVRDCVLPGMKSGRNAASGAFQHR